jgi:hypothetical protein
LFRIGPKCVQQIHATVEIKENPSLPTVLIDPILDMYIVKEITIPIDRNVISNGKISSNAKATVLSGGQTLKLISELYVRHMH